MMLPLCDLRHRRDFRSTTSRRGTLYIYFEVGLAGERKLKKNKNRIKQNKLLIIFYRQFAPLVLLEAQVLSVASVQRKG